MKETKRLPHTLPRLARLLASHSCTTSRASFDDSLSFYRKVREADRQTEWRSIAREYIRAALDRRHEATPA